MYELFLLIDLCYVNSVPYRFKILLFQYARVIQLYSDTKIGMIATILILLNMHAKINVASEALNQND